MKALVRLVLAFLLLAAPPPAAGRGHGHGHGHGHAGHGHGAHGRHGHGHARPHGHAPGGHGAAFTGDRFHYFGDGDDHLIADNALHAHSLTVCPIRFTDDAFCVHHGFQGAGRFYGSSPRSGSAPESDLGPWWVFLVLGRTVAKAAQWLIGS